MAKLIEATYGDALFELAVEESRVDSLYDEARIESSSNGMEWNHHPGRKCIRGSSCRGKS